MEKEIKVPEKFAARIDQLYELDYDTYVKDDVSYDIFPPTKQSIKTTELVLKLLDDADLADGIDPDEHIWQDNSLGVNITYPLEEGKYGKYVTMHVINNMIEIYTNVDHYTTHNRIIYAGDNPIKVAYKIMKYIDFAKDYLLYNDLHDCGIEDHRATINICVYENGLRFKCDDVFIDEFVEHGDCDKLINLVDDVCAISDPNTRYHVTEKGLQYLEELKKSES
jgi:hypothetical protein